MDNWPAQPPAASQVYVGICDGPGGAVSTFTLTFILSLALLPLSLGGAYFSTSPCVNFPPKEAVMTGPASLECFQESMDTRQVTPRWGSVRFFSICLVQIMEGRRTMLRGVGIDSGAEGDHG